MPLCGSGDELALGSCGAVSTKKGNLPSCRSSVTNCRLTLEEVTGVLVQNGNRNRAMLKWIDEVVPMTAVAKNVSN